MTDKYISSLNVATHRRDYPQPRHAGLMRIGCFIAGLLLSCVLYMVVSVR